MAKAKVKVKLNSAGVAAILKLPAVKKDLERRAQNIARAAGPGMRSAAEIGTDRARATVWTGTQAAKRAESEGRALTRAIDAGRN